MAVASFRRAATTLLRADSPVFIEKPPGPGENPSAAGLAEMLFDGAALIGCRIVRRRVALPADIHFDSSCSTDGPRAALSHSESEFHTENSILTSVAGGACDKYARSLA
jgi:hypothetical protein